MYTCVYCKNGLDQGEEVSVIKDNRLYLFCCNQCKEKWTSIIDAGEHLRFF